MIGYLHSYDKNRAALVFDLMEPLRPVVDRTVLQFIQSHTFDSADFTIRQDGVCRLNPATAKTFCSKTTIELQSNVGNGLVRLPR